LHKAAVALLAVPIIVTVYLGASLRRSTLARVGLALGVALVLGVGVISAGQPATTTANPTTPIVPLTSAAFTTTFATDHGVGEPVTIEFSTPMDRVSVAAALRVEPATPVMLAWDAADTVLTIAPQVHWAPGVLHTITVEAGALARSGQPLARPAREAFLTRAVTTGSAVATLPVGNRVSIDTAFLVRFVRPVDPATVETAIRLDPPTPGVVQASDPADDPTGYTFVPTTPLQPEATYRLVVSGVRDLDGAALDTITLEVRTMSAPAVVRFRPRADTKDVALETAISVRFTESMDRRSTARAFSVSAAGTPVAGKIRWAEADTVLVFTPSARLPYGTTVSMDVSTVARSVAGVQLGVAGHGTFQTIAKPAAPAAAKTTKPSPPPSSGGTAVGGGSWAAVETYYLGLMNCTRTGGWVTSTGHCSSPGGRAVAALKLDKGISSKVSRPYAKKLAVGNDCSHFIGGNPGDRLRRAGYTSYRWGENLGCRSGAPKAAVLGSHLFFQSEKSYGGGHYVNMMNAAYDRVGIGVWVYGGRVRLVVDFYHP
jgi:uncharacterized protein YkwD